MVVSCVSLSCDGGRSEELRFCVHHNEVVNNKCGELHKMTRRRGRGPSMTPDSSDGHQASYRVERKEQTEHKSQLRAKLQVERAAILLSSLPLIH